MVDIFEWYFANISLSEKEKGKKNRKQKTKQVEEKKIDKVQKFSFELPPLSVYLRATRYDSTYIVRHPTTASKVHRPNFPILT